MLPCIKITTIINSLMYNTNSTKEKKFFGGFNFIVVFWVLLSIFRLSVIVKDNPLSELFQFDLFTLLIPLLFLTVMNVLMGISLFFPQRQNHMWVLSLLIVTATVVTLNTFQDKLTLYKEGKLTQSTVYNLPY